MVNTDARFKVKDVGKINFFVYYRTRWTIQAIQALALHSLCLVWR